MHGLSKLCVIAGVVDSLDKELREDLNREVYSSPSSLLTTYDRKYKRHLSRIKLPISAISSDDIIQVTLPYLHRALCFIFVPSKF